MTVQKDLLEALRVLLLQPDAADAKTRGALEVDLTEVVKRAACMAADELRSGLCDSSAAAALCRFLATMAEVGVLADTGLPQLVVHAACDAAKLHSGDEHAQNWAIWLRAVIDDSLLLADLTTALTNSCTVTVRSALWVIQELAQRRELQRPDVFLPLVLQAMTMPDVGNRGSQALEALCNHGQLLNESLAAADRTTLLRQVEVLLGNCKDEEVVNALLAAISNLLGLDGHAHLLRSSHLMNDTSLVQAVLFHIGSPRKTNIDPVEVVQTDAIGLISHWADHTSEDVRELVLYSLQRLLDISSCLGQSCASCMSQGLICLVHVLSHTDISRLRPGSNLMQHFLHALNVVAACQLPKVRLQLGEHRESIWRVAHTRFFANDAQLDELKQLCTLVLALEGVVRLKEILQLRPINELLMRAACDVIADSDLEAADLSLHAVPIAESALELLMHYHDRGREPAFGELNAAIGVLGKALGFIDARATESSAKLVERGLVVLVQLVHHAHEHLQASCGYFGVLHHCFWSLREVASSAGGQVQATVAASRNFLRSHVVQGLSQALNSVRQRVVADDADDTEPLYAFEEGLTLLAVLQGHSCILEAMQLHPETRSVQATCCKVLKTLAQMNELHGDRHEVIAALQWAQREYDGYAEIDTPVAHALGLIQAHR